MKADAGLKLTLHGVLQPARKEGTIMVISVKWFVICLGVAGVCGLRGSGQELSRASRPDATPEALKAEIESLKAPEVAWRRITWKSCLLDGLRESRARNKPALLWVFIDRPVDDARC